MKESPNLLAALDGLTNSAKDEYRRMKLMLELYEPRPEVRTAILEAYNDPTWDWEKCDGCTLVDEAHSPKGMKFPPCVAHDYGCWKARQAPTHREACRIRQVEDKTFYRANLDFRTGWFLASRRWSGVRLQWWFYEKWKNKLKHVLDANQKNH